MVTRRRTRDEMALRDIEGRKWCSACHEWKPEDDFYTHCYASDGLASTCKLCTRLRTRAADLRYPERRKGYSRKHRTGVTQERFEALLASQGGVCAVCGASEPGGGGGWHLDHDHACCAGTRACGRCTRGALCARCNLALGLVHDDTAILGGMIGYLISSASRVLTYQRI